MKDKAILSWSGGKDSAMALHALLKSGLYEIVSLLTTVSEQYERISHHGVRVELLALPLARWFSVTLGTSQTWSP